jgi:hypothetical protein
MNENDEENYFILPVLSKARKGREGNRSIQETKVTPFRFIFFKMLNFEIECSADTEVSSRDPGDYLEEECSDSSISTDSSQVFCLVTSAVSCANAEEANRRDYSDELDSDSLSDDSGQELRAEYDKVVAFDLSAIF